jgi:nicotinamide riboside transporter PnuC
MQWLITVIALTGALFNARGKWQGFLFWLVSNTYWCYYNARIGEYPQAVTFAAFLCLTLHGLIHWRKRKPQYSKKHSPPCNG